MRSTTWHVRGVDRSRQEARYAAICFVMKASRLEKAGGSAPRQMSTPSIPRERELQQPEGHERGALGRTDGNSPILYTLR
jgi:hypothetical protein